MQWVWKTKGVGPSTTLARPGWKQPDISVKVDTERLEKFCTTLVLNVYWHGVRSYRVILYRTVHLGVSFFEGGLSAGGEYYMISCEWDVPEGHPGQCRVHLYAFVSYRRLLPLFQFSLSGVTLVYLSQCEKQRQRRRINNWKTFWKALEGEEKAGTGRGNLSKKRRVKEWEIEKKNK